MNTKETSADKTKYRLAEAAKKCMAASGTGDRIISAVRRITLRKNNQKYLWKINKSNVQNMKFL